MFKFEDHMKLMFEGALSAAEAIEAEKLLKKIEGCAYVNSFELSLGISAMLATLDPKSASYAVIQRLLKSILLGIGTKFTAPVREFLSENKLLEGDTFTDNFAAANAMSNFELIYTANEHIRKQKEAKMSERFRRSVDRFNAVGAKGKGKKSGSDNNIIHLGTYEEDGKKIPMFATMRAADIIGPAGEGRKDKKALRLEPFIVDANGVSRPAAGLYNRGNINEWLDENVGYRVKLPSGKMYTGDFTRRELNEKITAAQEQWEKQHNRQAVFQEPDTVLATDTYIESDGEGTFRMMPMPCDYPVGYDVMSTVATVTLSDIPAGHTATVTVTTTPNADPLALPAGTVTNAHTDKIAKTVQVEARGNSQPYTGKACTKCGMGCKPTTIKALDIKVPTEDERFSTALSKVLVWQGYEMCGKCRTALTQEADKVIKVVRNAINLEAKLLASMAEVIKDEEALAEANADLARRDEGLAKMVADKMDEAIIKTVQQANETFKFNTVGTIKKRVEVGNSKLTEMEKNINTQFGSVGIASTVTTGTQTTPVTSAITGPPANPNQAKVISKPDTANNKAVTKPAMKFNTVGAALQKAGITKSLTKKEKRAAAAAEKAAKQKGYRNQR